MQVLHRAIGTWRRKVDAFFTLTHFARQKFVDAGFPAERVHVKYNSVVPDPGAGHGTGRYAAFAARLAPEKGVACLLAAWRKHPDLPPLKIVGEGPLSGEVAAAAAADRRIEWLGHKSETEVHRVFGAARAVIMPSIWYETFGRTIAEAFAGGTPVVASRLGAMAELVDEGRTGWLFAPGDADDLARHVRDCWSVPADKYDSMRTAARDAYEREFTAERNFDRMIEIYEIALNAARRRRRSPVATGERVGAIALTSIRAGDV
jgi:glycosyltransferase involved in cell wall biosynthesis